MGNNNEHQELDLLTLIRKTFDFSYRVLKKIARFLGYLLQLAFRYKYVFLAVVAVTLPYAYYSSKVHKSYRAGMILELNNGDANFYSGEIAALNRFPSSLQLPDEYAGNFRGADISFSINPNDSAALRAELSFGFVNPHSFPVMKNALIDYFKRNEYLKAMNAARMASLEMTNNVIDQNLAELDSLSKIEYFVKNAVEVTVSNTLLLRAGKQMFYPEKLTLLEEKAKVAEALAVKSEIVTVLSEFQPVPATSFFSFAVKYLTISIISFLLLAMLWSNRKCIMNYLQGGEKEVGDS